MPNVLIVGGTSGLGYELAYLFADHYEEVLITGRTEPEKLPANCEFWDFELSKANLSREIGFTVSAMPKIDVLVYAAGWFLDGHIGTLADSDIEEMLNVGGRAYLYFVKKIIEHQGELPELIAISSTSSRVPREYEPVYNFVKAGMNLAAEALSLDPVIGRVLTIVPSGMNTRFWRNSPRDTNNMLDALWVAKQIMDLRKYPYERHLEANIFGAHGGQPDRVILTKCDGETIA